MTTTTNYGYTVVVGSDTPVNIQNDIAPNFTAIDTDLKAVSDSSITQATHTVVGTVHNLVRADADRNVLYFVATGDMALGDTFTVDGVTVTARLVNGENLATGSFKINNNVLGILVGTVLNLYVPGASITATDTTYDNSGSGLTATNVQDAIDELKSDIPVLTASATSYDNTGSGLTATNVQDAIDELVGNFSLAKTISASSLVNNAVISVPEIHDATEVMFVVYTNACAQPTIFPMSLLQILDGSDYAHRININCLQAYSPMNGESIIASYNRVLDQLTIGNIAVTGSWTKGDLEIYIR